jgi:fibronectin type 3 domain-containing protein
VYSLAHIPRSVFQLGLLAVVPVLGWSQFSACDVNKDGLINIVDVQIATNNALSCTSLGAYSTFVPQVITGVLSSCQVTTGIHTVFLNWTATSGATYNIYRATTSGGYNYSSPLVTGLSGPPFVDCSVALSQTYYYVIRAVANGSQSINSSEVTAMIPAT